MVYVAWEYETVAQFYKWCAKYNKTTRKTQQKRKKENPQVKDEFLKTPKLTKIHKEKVSEILYILKKRLPERDKLKTELNIWTWNNMVEL